MIKKQITFLASLGVLSTVAPLAISCGFSTDEILTRVKSDMSTYNTSYNMLIRHWSSGTTYTESDATLLSDLIGTLVSSDKYNRAFGDLAIDKDLSDTTVGKSLNSDNTQWSYDINPQAKWFNADGSIAGNITAHDLVNTAKYVAYPGNDSEVLGLWAGMVKGIADINKILSSATNPAEELLAYYWDDTNHGAYVINYKDDNGDSQSITVAELWNPNTSGFGVSVDPNDEYKVTFTLEKPAYYFDYLMQYLGFAPMPSKALPLGPNYDKQENILYSGAYLYKGTNSTFQLTYVKNPNYVHAAQTYIDTLKFNFAGDNESVSDNRILFEAGDLDNFVVDETDSTGWDRYVGSDVNNPIFPGALSELQPEIRTQCLIFNFSHQGMLNGDSEQKSAAARQSLALQIPEIRKFIATHLNRVLGLKYYSQKTDLDPQKSSWVRNVYTPSNFIKDKSGRDYTEYVAQQYAANILKDPAKAVESQTVLADGNDAYLNNNAINNNVSKEDIHKIIKDNFNVDQISFDFLMDGSLSTSWNLYLNDMISDFNSQFGDVIAIKQKVSADKAQFQQWDIANEYAISSFGWGADYPDPMTFLHTFTLKGDLEDDFGAFRLFGDQLDLDTDNTDPTNIITTAPTLNANDLLQVYSDQFKLVAPNSWDGIVNNWYDEMKNYTDEVYAADREQDMGSVDGGHSARFEAQALAEVNGLYKDALWVPFYVKNGSMSVSVSYALPKSIATVGYGGSKYKHWGLLLSNHLLNKAERELINRRYEEELAIINANPGALMEDYY